MPGSSSLTFSTRRAPRRRVSRLLRWLVVLLLVAAVTAAVVAVGLWGYAWMRLDADPVATLDADLAALGVDGAAAPTDATTVLVTITAERDPASREGPELRGPVRLVQAGGPREVPAVLLLPEELRVSADGEGNTTLARLQVSGDSDAVLQAVTDYTGVRVDHVVSVEEDLLPSLVGLWGPVPVCGEGGCRDVDAPEVRDTLADASPEQRTATVASLLRGLSTVVRPGHLLTSPVATKRGIDALATVRTDVGLRGGRLLDLARAFEGFAPPEIATVPLLHHPDTGRAVQLEQAEVLFQRLAEGASLDGVVEDEATAAEEAVGDVPVAVLNAAGIDGLAGRVETRLEAAGFRVVGTGNAASFEESADTVVGYAPDDPAAEATAILLAERLPDAQLKELEQAPDFEGEPVAVRVLAGADLDDEE